MECIAWARAGRGAGKQFKRFSQLAQLLFTLVSPNISWTKCKMKSTISWTQHKTKLLFAHSKQRRCTLPRRPFSNFNQQHDLPPPHLSIIHSLYYKFLPSSNSTSILSRWQSKRSGKNCQTYQIHFLFQNSLLSPLAYQQHLLMAISMRAISDGSSFCLRRTSWEHATAGEKGERKGDIRVRTWLNIGISAN